MARLLLFLSSFFCVASALLALARPAGAQTSDSARLYVTVLDPTNAGVPGAMVTVLGLEDSTRKSALAPVVSNERGMATLDRLVPGRYAIQATLSGFDPGMLSNVTIRRGDNRHVIVLSLKAVTETVTVGGGQEGASNRSAAAFGVTLSADAIETLSDDPTELRRQLMDLAGPDAVIRVDSFEESQLPSASQIKSVHVTRDQFAAEAEYPGNTFVDVITQPGSGPLSGNVNTMYRANGLAGVSPFLDVRPPEASRSLNGTIGGTLIKNKSDFSLSVNAQRRYTTPVLKLAGAPAVILDQRQPYSTIEMYSILNYALTKDQTLRVGYAMARQHQSNLGIGLYDSPERAYGTDFIGYQMRLQEAGPIGRRTFQNTRLQITSIDQFQHSNIEAPTIIIQDDRTTGGAQMAGVLRQRTFYFTSDVDHIRGINSWRTGVQLNGGWYDSTFTSGYLGTYTFADDAAFAAGRPLLYTQTIGSPRVTYFNAQAAVYLQDDLRISKSLTLSPGVRYTGQTHVHDARGIAPRFGTTWSPFKSGHTAFRVSAGLFYWPMEMSRVYEQALRFDGHHQQQVIVINPSYPNPGPLTGLPPNKYEIGDYSLQRNLRYSAGMDHTFSPRVRMNVLYAYVHQFNFWRGDNLNAPVNGVRPDPAFANVIMAVTDGQTRRHDVTLNLNVSMIAPSPAANQKRFNWKRMSLSASYGRIRAWQSGDGGPFTPPPTGTIDTEWSVAPADQPYRVNGSLTSTQLKNLNVNVSWNRTAGGRYTLTTGIDDNQDGILNDRPAGVPLRSLLMAPQTTVNLRANYTIATSGTGSAGAGNPSRRYRIGLTFNVTNLTNHSNYGGYSGNMTSQDFMTPTLVVNPRRADVSMNLAF